MTFQRSCLYHPTQGMRVLEESEHDEYERLLETGVWFNHPLKAKEWREDYEKQIRQQPRERRSNAKHPSKTV